MDVTAILAQGSKSLQLHPGYEWGRQDGRKERLSRDQLRRYAPAHTHLKIVDWLQICLYTAAYITSTLATPLDDQLYYEVGAAGTCIALAVEHAKPVTHKL
eukprot:1157656-Pelagomonas_calceolata.AAC.1